MNDSQSEINSIPFHLFLLHFLHYIPLPNTDTSLAEFQTSELPAQSRANKKLHKFGSAYILGLFNLIRDWNLKKVIGH